MWPYNCESGSAEPAEFSKCAALIIIDHVYNIYIYLTTWVVCSTWRSCLHCPYCPQLPLGVSMWECIQFQWPEQRLGFYSGFSPLPCLYHDLKQMQINARCRHVHLDAAVKSCFNMCLIMKKMRSGLLKRAASIQPLRTLIQPHTDRKQPYMCKWAKYETTHTSSI